MNESIENHIKKAEEADGYLITVTRLEEGKLLHWQKHEGFFPRDILPSLHEMKMILIKTYPHLNIKPTRMLDA